MLASSGAPTPLYAIYQQRWGFTPITTTVIFGIYAITVLVALLIFGRLSDYTGRRPVLLAAIAVQAASLVVFATAGGVGDLHRRPRHPGHLGRGGARRDRRGHARHRP